MHIRHSGAPGRQRRTAARMRTPPPGISISSIPTPARCSAKPAAAPCRRRGHRPPRQKGCGCHPRGRALPAVTPTATSAAAVTTASSWPSSIAPPPASLSRSPGRPAARPGRCPTGRSVEQVSVDQRIAAELAGAVKPRPFSASRVLPRSRHHPPRTPRRNDRNWRHCQIRRRILPPGS